MQDKSTFMRMREDEREIRKTLIINAAMILFERMPFQDIGMRDIAAEAGVSAASIYRYFPSRDDLFAEALIRDIIIVEQRFEKRMEDQSASIEEFAVEVSDYLIDNEPTYQMMSYFMTKNDMEPQIISRFNTVSRYFLDLLDQVLMRAGARKEKVQVYSQAFFASLTGIIMAFRNYPGRSREEKRKQIHKLALLIAAVFRKGMDTV
ncbi:MAG: TetR/AcrR family transcriptional regulator [Desulfobacteraceae bacterium]|nr:MAG: TetR/AcrR family transcriptional regulator [Desulfobacteraceae bacterium]